MTKPPFSLPLHVVMLGYQESAPGKAAFTGLLTERSGDTKALPLFRTQEEIRGHFSKHPPPEDVTPVSTEIDTAAELNNFIESVREPFGVTHVYVDPAGIRRRIRLTEFTGILKDTPEPEEFSARLADLIRRQEIRFCYPLYAVARGTGDSKPQPSDYCTIPGEDGDMVIVFDSPFNAADAVEMWPDRFPAEHRCIRLGSTDELERVLRELCEIGVEFVGLDPLGLRRKYLIRRYLGEED